ncbi:MAG: FAD-binding protein, partial [Microbacteriaceae bacterium]
MAESKWDKEVDVLVAGTGAAGLTAAITAKHGGADTLIVESEAVWGGTTSWSGGGLWIPDNSLAKNRGFKDSEEEALQYMNEVIGFSGKSSSPERRKAYVQNAKKAVDFLGEQGVDWFLSTKYPDYYPEAPGGRAGGRALESNPFNTKKLGDWRKTAGGETMGIPLPLRTDDVWLIMRAWSTWSGFFRGVKFFFRVMAGLITGKRLRGFGYALASHYFHI